MKRVLLLNSTYEPIDTVDVERAMVLILTQKVEILHQNINKKIRTISLEFPYPEVVRLRSFVKLKRRRYVPTKRNIFLRDGYKCVYCGSKKELTVDHVIPVSRGGKNTWNNMVTACHKCNNIKADKTPEEANLVMITKPFTPSYLHPYRDYSRHHEIKSWEDYIFLN